VSGSVARREAPLGALARIQARVIGALVLRELQTRFGRRGIGFLWMFLEPLILAAAIGAFRYVWRGGLHPDLPPFLFYFVGYVPFFMFRAILMRSSTAVQANHSLLFHRQVTVLDIMVARNLLEIGACVTVVIAVLFIAGVYFGEWPSDPLLFAFALLLSALLATGFGLVFGALAAINETVQRLTAPLTYVMLPISGVMWMVHDFPPQFREGILWVPMVSVHEAMREAQFGSRVTAYYDLPYVGFWVLALIFLGLCALRAIRGRLSIA
jgi:capsular polysaccharide transport system permease protein